VLHFKKEVTINYRLLSMLNSSNSDSKSFVSVILKANIQKKSRVVHVIGHSLLFNLQSMLIYMFVDDFFHFGVKTCRSSFLSCNLHTIQWMNLEVVEYLYLKVFMRTNCSFNWTNYFCSVNCKIWCNSWLAQDPLAHVTWWAYWK
jgi:hypothetical protein